MFWKTKLYKLKRINQRLMLIDDADQDTLGKPICVDFTEGTIRHRIDYGGGKRQLLARAIGCHKRRGLRVVDATAGLGKDSFVFASLGCHVIALERNPDIYALLADGLLRGQQLELEPLTRIALFHTDSQTYLEGLGHNQAIDVVYFDPMYPHSGKSALVKKDMRILRQVVGDDHDNAQLIQTALQKAKYRVVVKRPLHAGPYAGLKPSFDYKGKRSRFDIYLPQ